MTISIERLLTMTAVRTSSFEPRYGYLSTFTKEDALGVQTQVQRKHPIGLKVLESKIVGCEVAGHALLEWIELKLIALGLSQTTAAPLALLALLAWREVCGSLRCKSCNGVGKKRYRTLNECLACCGTGKTLLTPKKLARDYSILVGKKITSKVFANKYYDLYIYAVDQLHKCESDAALYARRYCGL